MKIIKALAAALAAFFIVGSAQAQNVGTVTSHAFAVGKGAGKQGFTSLLCASAQIAVGQAAADPICQTLSGDVTLTAAGVTAIGANKVTVGMMATLAADKLIGNPTGSTATPQAFSLTNCSNALTYSTSTHSFGCNVGAGTGTVTTLTAGPAITFSSGTTCTSTCTISGPVLKVQAFTASGTFTTPATATTSTVYHIRLVGGGAGGQGGNTGSTVGAGGGAGAYNEFWCTGVAGSIGISITIGTGGAGGAAGGGAASNGTGSSYVCNGTTVSANGGGVSSGAGPGGAGGASTNGTINITGGNGSGGGALTTNYPVNFGGSNPLGVGGPTNTSTGVGGAGSGCGGGGSGGWAVSAAGGAGANGCAIVDYVL